MKIFFERLPEGPEILIRRAGYAEHRDRHSPEVSYTKRLGPDFYPRFHIYIEELQNGVFFNLHIDQKKPSYGVVAAHSGEYEGSVVEREASRLREFVLNYAAPQKEPSKKKSFWNKFFG